MTQQKQSHNLVFTSILRACFLATLAFLLNFFFTGGFLSGVCQYPLITHLVKNKRIDVPAKTMGALVASLPIALMLGIFVYVFFAITIVLPSIFLAYVALNKRGDKEQLVDAFATIYGLVAVIGTGLWFLLGFEGPLHVLMDMAMQKVQVSPQLEPLLTQAKALIGLIPGILVSALIMGSSAAIHFAQKRHPKLFKKNGLKLHLSSITFPRWVWGAASVLLFAGIACYNQPALLKPILNLNLVLSSFFMLQGISILAQIQKSKKFPAIILLIFFSSMLVFSWLNVILVVLGILEPFLGFREKIRQSKF